MKLKCTFCGSNELIKSALPYCSGCDEFGRVSCNDDDVEVYLCLSCGHIEIFRTSKVKEYSELCKKIAQYEEKLNKAKPKIEERKAYNEEVMNERRALVEERKQLEEESESLDITIRRKQELTTLIKEKSDELMELMHKKETIDEVPEKVKEYAYDLLSLYSEKVKKYSIIGKKEKRKFYGSCLDGVISVNELSNEGKKLFADLED